MNIYVTGDTHGGTDKIIDICEKMETTKEDILIILGDACLNYHGWPDDNGKKERLGQCQAVILCIHGNHERRPESLPYYQLKEWHGGEVWVEEEYPNILFAKDGSVFDFDGKKVFVIGGAYSIDKNERYFRWLARETKDLEWWPDEQPSEAIKKYCEEQLEKHGWKVDVVLSHTCPQKYVPTEAFLEGYDAEKIDMSTEEWLDVIEDKLECQKWCCGHFHIDKSVDKMRFFFDEFEKL